MKTPVYSKRHSHPAGKNPFTGEVNAYIDDLRHQFHVPSISIGVIDGDQTFISPFGDAKVNKTKATEDTLYYIASLTKSFTATTLLSVLAKQTKKRDAVTLKTKISSILREDFVLQDEYATAHATLEDALTHVLGVGPHDSFNYGGDGYSLKDAVHSMRHLSMTAELREMHQYLNMGYMVIQHVIETLTGKPIEECHQKYIWDPLGMASTYICLEDAEASPQVLADGYSWDPVMQHLDDAEHVNDYPLVGGGGIITSIKDLTTHLNAIIHKTLPLGSSWQEELFKPRVVAGSAWYKGSSTPLYCLGWATFHYRGQTVVMHNGAIDGFNSMLLFLPDMKWGIAILANANPNGMNAIEVVVQRLLDDRLSIPHADREDQLSKQLHKLANSIEDPVDTRKRLYPSIPEPPLPLHLPLEKIYWHVLQCRLQKYHPQNGISSKGHAGG